MRLQPALVLPLLCLVACGGDAKSDLDERRVTSGARELATFSKNDGVEPVVIFEAGLGDTHAVWAAQAKAASSGFVSYDRAGYGDSTIDASLRDVDALRVDLQAVIDAHTAAKVVLVGHSLGGFIIRAYAAQQPARVAAMVFVDASHELYNQPSQEEVDIVVKAFRDAGLEGAAQEARNLIADAAFMAQVGGLPDVPVVVIDSMKIDGDHDEADRRAWYDAKQSLSAGVTDFTHLTTTKSGHYIMRQEPGLVNDAIASVLEKL